MLHSTRLAAAFADGPANPNNPADWPRFRSQAYWLGKCADVVYPPTPTEDSPPEYEEENRIDRQAEADKRAYRKQRPWWRTFSEKTPEQKKAEEKWHESEREWAAVARDRIAKEVAEFWVPAGETLPAEFEVSFHSCVGTQFFVAKDRNTVIVCFRGTEPKKRRDILTDILSMQASDEKHHGKIHLGFCMALDHVWDDVGAPSSGESLPELLSRNSLRDNQQAVWFTGHSLGGALATLAADRLLVTEILSEKNVGGVFTFGQPRVGDKKFVEGYPLSDRHFRFVNNNDAVTRIPPKSLALVSMIFGKLFKKASQPEASQPEGRETQGSMNFGDMGQVVFANRSGDLKLLDPGSFQWQFQLFHGRAVSRFMALFKLSGVMNRLFPGLQDHSMVGYIAALDRFDSSPGASSDDDAQPEADS